MANTKIPAELLGLNGGDLVLDADGDTKIDAATDDEIHFTVAGSETVYMGVTSYNSSDRIVLLVMPHIVVMFNINTPMTI